MFACNLCSSASPASDTIHVDLNLPSAEGRQLDPISEEAANEPSPPSFSGRFETVAHADAKDVREQAVNEPAPNGEPGDAAAVVEERSADAVEATEPTTEKEQAEGENAEAEPDPASGAAGSAEAAEGQEQVEHDQQAETAADPAPDSGVTQHLIESSEQDQEKLAAFLKIHGYSAADVRRKVKLFGYKYPLHSAVKANDADMIRILMEAGANPSAKNSAGQTPKDFARKVDKKASHSSVMRALGGC